MTSATEKLRIRRKKRIRGRVHGTELKPRLSIFRSAKHIYAQVVDDDKGRTVVAASSAKKGGAVQKKEQAKAVGKAIAEACKSQGITKVVFDRNGFLYHGRVRALADGAREAGLEF